MNKKDFTKKDIKNGAVVITRNGEKFLKVDNTLLELTMTGEFLNINNFDKQLKAYSKEYDIMKVLNPAENNVNKNCCNLALYDIKATNIKWTWERKD